MSTRNFSSRPDGRLTISGQVRNLTSPRSTVTARIKGSNFSFGRVLELWPPTMEPALRAKVDKSLSGGRITSIGIDAAGVFNRSNKVFDVTTLDMISDIRQVRLETKFASLDRLVGSLASRLEVSIGNNGIIEHAAADFILRDALMLPRGRAVLSILKVLSSEPNFRAAVSRSHAQRLMRVNCQLALTANVDINSNWHPHRLDLEVRAEQVDTLLLAELWPENVRPGHGAGSRNVLMAGRSTGSAFAAVSIFPKMALCG